MTSLPQIAQVLPFSTSGYLYISENKQHLHTLHGKPLTGCSSVAKIIGKEGLTWWAAGEALKPMGWTPIYEKDGNGKRIRANRANRIAYAAEWMLSKVFRPEEPEAWLKFLDDCYYAHNTKKNEAADTGVDRHKIVEKYVLFCIAFGGGEPFSAKAFGEVSKEIAPFISWSVRNVKRFLWAETHCYSESLWVGGISDCGAELKDGSIAVIDFKSSGPYAPQFWQCAGYGLMIEENGGFTPMGERIFTLDRPITKHIVFPFGAEKPTAYFSLDTVESDREAFRAEVMLYRKLAKYEG